MKRTEKTILEYKQQLTDKGINNILEFVELIISADITKGKYTRFLLDCFITDKFRLEDLQGGLESTIGQAVSLFHKHKAKLPEEMRSVTKYATPGDLWQAVKEFETVMTGKEEKHSEKEKAYAETEFVYHDETSGFQIISPLTKNSAQWWGKGTRWCTSAENNNMFEEYAIQAPLFVIIMPDGNKLQLWKNNKDIQFMDKSDNTIELDYIENNWKHLKEICLSLNKLEFIPEKYRTVELYKLAVQQNVSALRYVPENIGIAELYNFSVKQNGFAIKYVLGKYITPELCELAIEQDGNAIMYVPKEHKTYGLCKIAIQQNGWALQFLPEELKTPELCKLAIEQNGRAIRFIPMKRRTPELCQLAVQQNGTALFYVPEEYRTPELCKIAVQQNGNALELVPEKIRTQELYQLAIEQNGNNLRLIPKELKTFELCLLSVKSYGLALYYVPEQLKTPELCEVAVKQDGRTLCHIPNEFITLELCKLAVAQNIEALEFIPEELKSQITIPKFSLPDYTEKYNKIRSLFPGPDLLYKP